MCNSKCFRRFIFIWSGELLSSVGSGLTAFTLTASVFSRTGRASDCALILLFSFLPSFLLSPFTGVLADRLDRRLMMTAGNMVAALGVFLTLLMMTLQPDKTGALYPGLIVSSLGSAFVKPAWKASVTDLLPREFYTRASGLVQLSGAASLLVSPLVAGCLMAITDIRTILIADIVTFLVSALILRTVRNRNGKQNGAVPESNNSFRKDLVTGLQTLGQNRGIMTLVILITLILFFVSLLQTLLAPLVLSFTDAAQLGFIQSFCAVGVLLGSLFLGIMKKNTSRVRMLRVSLGAMGFFFTFIGLREHFLMILIPGFLFFLTLPFVNTSAEVLIRSTIRNEEQGRAWGLISFITNTGAVTAYGLGGFLSDFMGRSLGCGPGRASAVLFLVSGVSVMVLSFLIAGRTEIKSLENSRVLKEAAL